MKKVLIGILILIPIIILLVVALVTNLLQLEAWVAVERLDVNDRLTGLAVSELQPALDVDENMVYDMNEFVEVLVYPENANQTVDWTFSNIQCTDDEYRARYEAYTQDSVGSPVYPAAVLVDDEGFGFEGSTNTTGRFKLYAYCTFEVTVSAETKSQTFSVNIVGNSVKTATLTNLDGEKQATMTVGQSMRLSASFVPLDSIVDELTYESDAPAIVSVDENGVITAIGEGSANVRAKASKYDGEGYVDSNDFVVTVTAGASSYGDSVTLARAEGNKYAFSLLGVEADAIDEANSTGISVESDGITIGGTSATVALTNGKTLAVSVCEQDDIKIDHAELFADAGGYVLDVNERELKLTASYAATADSRELSGVSWSSSNAQVASVDSNGVVRGLSNGAATITATAGSHTSSVTLNVHKKVSSLRLKTSDTSLRLGLARETVFAAYKYKYETEAEGGDKALEKAPNSVQIRLYGEPEEASERTAFYEDFAFEVEDGEEYAHFDASIPNLLVFDGEALESKGVVPVKVGVRAKYPRFETSQTHTSGSVTLNVVYGVAVDSFDKAIRAGRDQRLYAFGDKETLDGVEKDRLVGPGNISYRVVETEAPQGNFAMVITGDFMIPEGFVLNFREEGKVIALYGNMYGNGRTIAGMPDNIDGNASFMVKIACSDVTVSNVTLRHEDIKIEKLDSKTFKDSYCLIAYSENTDKERLTGINVEYCVFENSHCGVEFDNADAKISGCLVRNISSIGVFNYAKVYKTDDCAEDERYLVFSNLELHNCVFSSIIAVSVSSAHEGFSLDGKMGRFSTSTDQDTSREESYKWVEDNLVPKGYVASLRQTGFLDIYNWQNAADANLIDTGDDNLNGIIGVAIQPLFGHPLLKQGVYTIEKEGIKTDYFHVGLMTTGIVIDSKVYNERTFTQYTFEDDRFFSIVAREIPDDYPGVTGKIKSTVKILQNFELTLFCYKNDSSLTPMSTYVVNNQFIEHLHS